MSRPAPFLRPLPETSATTEAMMKNKPATRKENTDLLQRGIMCVLIGLAVLIAPSFMGPTGMRDAVAGSSLVGWFALVLGVAFLGLYARRRMLAAKDRS
jgi:hypothetical protein